MVIEKNFLHLRDQDREKISVAGHKPLVKCPTCSKQFSTRKKLLNHMKIHNSEKPGIKEEKILESSGDIEFIRYIFE